MVFSRITDSYLFSFISICLSSYFIATKSPDVLCLARYTFPYAPDPIFFYSWKSEICAFSTILKLINLIALKNAKPSTHPTCSTHWVSLLIRNTSGVQRAETKSDSRFRERWLPSLAAKTSQTCSILKFLFPFQHFGLLPHISWFSDCGWLFKFHANSLPKVVPRIRTVPLLRVPLLSAKDQISGASQEQTKRFASNSRGLPMQELCVETVRVGWSWQTNDEVWWMWVDS